MSQARTRPVWSTSSFSPAAEDRLKTSPPSTPSASPAGLHPADFLWYLPSVMRPTSPLPTSLPTCAPPRPQPPPSSSPKRSTASPSTWPRSITASPAPPDSSFSRPVSTYRDCPSAAPRRAWQPCCTARPSASTTSPPVSNPHSLLLSVAVRNWSPPAPPQSFATIRARPSPPPAVASRTSTIISIAASTIFSTPMLPRSVRSTHAFTPSRRSPSSTAATPWCSTPLAASSAPQLNSTPVIPSPPDSPTAPSPAASRPPPPATSHQSSVGCRAILPVSASLRAQARQSRVSPCLAVSLKQSPQSCAVESIDDAACRRFSETRL